MAKQLISDNIRGPEVPMEDTQDQCSPLDLVCGTKSGDMNENSPPAKKRSALSRAWEESTTKEMRQLPPGLIKILPDGQLRLGPNGVAAVSNAIDNAKDGFDVTYYPHEKMFVVINRDK